MQQTTLEKDEHEDKLVQQAALEKLQQATLEKEEHENKLVQQAALEKVQQSALEKERTRTGWCIKQH